jgi:hypothetical protein
MTGGFLFGWPCEPQPNSNLSSRSVTLFAAGDGVSILFRLQHSFSCAGGVRGLCGCKRLALGGIWFVPWQHYICASGADNPLAVFHSLVVPRHLGRWAACEGSRQGSIGTYTGYHTHSRRVGHHPGGGTAARQAGGRRSSSGSNLLSSCHPPDIWKTDEAFGMGWSSDAYHHTRGRVLKVQVWAE